MMTTTSMWMSHLSAPCWSVTSNVLNECDNNHCDTCGNAADTTHRNRQNATRTGGVSACGRICGIPKNSADETGRSGGVGQGIQSARTWRSGLSNGAKMEFCAARYGTAAAKIRYR